MARTPDKSSSSSAHAIEDTITLNGGTVEMTGSGGDQIDDLVINVAGSSTAPWTSTVKTTKRSTPWPEMQTSTSAAGA